MIDKHYTEALRHLDDAGADLLRLGVYTFAITPLRRALYDAAHGGTPGDVSRVAGQFESLAASVHDAAPHTAKHLLAAARVLLASVGVTATPTRLT